MIKYSSAAKNQLRALPLAPRVDERSRMRILADKAGICLSVMCIIHCMLTPVVLLLLPAMEVFKWWDGSVHVTFALIIPLLALGAFIPGYRLHGNARVFTIAAVGFAFILVGITVPHVLHKEWLEPLITIPGSLFLVRSHMLNRSLCACCRSGHGKH